MGYLPRDLLMSEGFVRRAGRKNGLHGGELRGSAPLLVGAATLNPAPIGRPLFNSAVLLRDGAVGPAFHKMLLPTYDVFDEDRYFEPAAEPQILELNGWRLGISICEDVWNDRDFWERPRYHRDPIEVLAQAGAQAMIQSFGVAVHGGQATSARAHAQPHGAEIRVAVGDRGAGGRR
jgi:NAD+ synthase (glutamine-hydrolysing)